MTASLFGKLNVFLYFLVKNNFTVLPWWLLGKKSAYQFRKHGFEPWSGKIQHAGRATVSMHHNYWACALEPVSHIYWNLHLSTCSATREVTAMRSLRSTTREQPLLATAVEKPVQQLKTSVQFSSVAQLCLTLCNPMNCSTPGLSVHHQLLEFTQTHVHRVSDAIQPFHPLSSPSPPAPNPSQHQGLFQWVNSSNEVAKVLEFQLQHQSFQWTLRTDLL